MLLLQLLLLLLLHRCGSHLSENHLIRLLEARHVIQTIRPTSVRRHRLRRTRRHTQPGDRPTVRIAAAGRRRCVAAIRQKPARMMLRIGQRTRQHRRLHVVPLVLLLLRQRGVRETVTPIDLRLLHDVRHGRGERALLLLAARRARTGAGVLARRRRRRRC